ncbi:glycine-rich rna binding protein [Fusarium tjaetaba]|uniref:Glycine-rich rna binding protein n=1 Tax=Fusarium tjaetaba TaxID=1567544 RepID=A0A8H5W5G0_9HYPO|nr:glycine-rich rna binding protein [Fusarium tjaetaba]KAF5646085.1 glycine-rich rna binding protein [Fusarium tjaetaba]
MAAADLVINNIARDTDEETLMQVFSEYGEVLNTIVMRDRDTGKSCHFGFVTFSTAEEAEMARTRMHNQELDGRRVRVSYGNIRR